MKAYAGIDLHSSNNYVGIIDEHDKRLYGKRLPNELNQVLLALEPFRDRLEGVVVESTYNWYWLVDGLMEHGYNLHLANPCAIKQYEGLKHTDDKWDSFFLAHMLRLNILPDGYIYPSEHGPVRDLLRRRLLFVRQRTAHILSLQSMITRNLGVKMSSSAIKKLKEKDAENLFDSPNLVSMRVSTKGFNKKSLESLIKAGAMDSLGERNQLLTNIDSILAHHKEAMEDRDSGQSSLLAGLAVSAAAPELNLRAVPPATKREKLAWERELLGLYVSEHPFKEYDDYFRGLLTPLADLPNKLNQRGLVRVGGLAFSIRQIMTKNNDPMCFVQLGDTGGYAEVVVFPSVFKEKPEIWVQDAPFVIEGKVQERDGEIKILCEKAHPINAETASRLKELLKRGGFRSPGTLCRRKSCRAGSAGSSAPSRSRSSRGPTGCSSSPSPR